MKIPLRNRKVRNDARRQHGFTLVELAIVLSVAGLMFVGLWRLLASGNQQVRDQSAASQAEQVISAAKSYLASTVGQTFMQGINASTYKNVPMASLTAYLPSGFAGVNSYGQGYAVQVLKDNSPAGQVPNTYSFMVVTTGGDAIPDTSGGRVSAFIGGDGGFIYSSPATGVCGLPLVQMACGSYGAWATNTQTTYGFGLAAMAGATTSGHIATQTYVSPTVNSQLPWLERNTTLQPDPTFSWNTMAADLYMGTTTEHAGYSNMYLAPSGSTTGGSTINMEGGTISMEGGTISGTGTSNISLATSAATASPLESLSGTAEPNTYLLNATNGCNFNYNTVTNSFTGAQVATGTPCTFSINTDNINMSGLLNANGLYATTFIYTGSDIRLKANIHPIVDPLDDIMKLKPVSYTYKSNGMPGMGVIAQELEKIYPQLVIQQVDGMKSVNYNGLIGPLIGAVQELKKENDDLRQQLKTQREREDKLERELKSGSNSTP